MSTKTRAETHFRYSLAPITLPDVKPGSCRGVFHGEGLDLFDALAENTAAVRPNMMDSDTVKMILRAYFTEIALSLALNRRVSLGEVGTVLSVEVGGSFPSMDAQPGEENPLYVRISLDRDYWALPSGVIPQRVEETADDPRLFDVADAGTCTPRTINGMERFHVTGKNLSANGSDEALTLTDSASVTHAAVVTSVTRGQRIEAHLATTPAAGKATLELLTHGYQTPDGRLKSLTKKVNVLAGDVPPRPTVMKINDDDTFQGGGGNIVTGANMRFVNDDPGGALVIKDPDGTEVSAMLATDEQVPVTESRFGLSINGDFMAEREYMFEFTMLDAEGHTVKVTKKATFVE